MAIEIFFSYAHEDEALMNAVRQQLVIFERQGRIIKWHDRQIPPGTEWAGQIDQRLRLAHIILLFVSPAFLESRYCWDVEVTTALERHQRGEARVIPIILRPCAWQAAPFARLQALPTDARPVSQAIDRDQITLEIAEAVMRVADELSERPHAVTGDSAAPARTGITKRLMDGDRIPRLVVPFSPPTGVNIPPGYQRRLNQIASDVVRAGAVRREGGGFQYPAQFKGPADRVSQFVELARTRGRLESLGQSTDAGTGEVWFEYQGDCSPEELRDLATSMELRLVHCGATLLLDMSSAGSSQHNMR